MKTILVTGANGQLGKALRRASKKYSQHIFLFAGREELDITREEDVKTYFAENDISICVNAAAFTAVDKAEGEATQAWRVNAEGPRYLASACTAHHVKLIHISTDFVFDGSQNVPYRETDPTAALGEYGKSKLQGEHMALNHKETVVVRTSWVYSLDGHNFLNTMLRLGKERDSLRVVYDQVGTPTLTDDLAGAILKVALDDQLGSKYGIYHYSNEGVASWYDFAKAIMQLAELDCHIDPVLTSEYPTPAKRPPYSVLHKEKIKNAFGLEIPHWRESLEKCLKDY